MPPPDAAPSNGKPGRPMRLRVMLLSAIAVAVVLAFALYYASDVNAPRGTPGCDWVQSTSGTASHAITSPGTWCESFESPVHVSVNWTTASGEMNFTIGVSTMGSGQGCPSDPPARLYASVASSGSDSFLVQDLSPCWGYSFTAYPSQAQNAGSVQASISWTPT